MGVTGSRYVSMEVRYSSVIVYDIGRWAKHCHKQDVTGNGEHTICHDGDNWEMVYGIVVPTFILWQYNVASLRLPRYMVNVR